MRALHELVDQNEPGIRLMRQWVEESDLSCTILQPSEAREQVLTSLQITTRSPLGAIAYETGGILVDGGWLRFLGSGHPQLRRTLPGWNDRRSSKFMLVADDVVGGFFAINGGFFGSKLGNVHYWPPDDLEWEDMGLGFTDFLIWSLSAQLHEFYASLRWPLWESEVERIHGDQCLSFYPFLWAAEGSLAESSRRAVPAEEAYDSKVEIVRQLNR